MPHCSACKRTKTDMNMRFSVVTMESGHYDHLMRVISRRHLRHYWAKHPETEHALKAWYDGVTSASWKTPQDVKKRHAAASFVGHNRIVFNIKGNAHRLVVAVEYRFGLVYIKFIGTHAAYDKVDVATISMDTP